MMLVLVPTDRWMRKREGDKRSDNSTWGLAREIVRAWFSAVQIGEGGKEAGAEGMRGG